VGARRLGQDEQYLTVREILSEASTLVDGALSREQRFLPVWVCNIRVKEDSLSRTDCGRMPYYEPLTLQIYFKKALEFFRRRRGTLP
jgi:hypothetical protein